MFIKIDDQIINLDLVLKIEEVTHTDEVSYYYNTAIGFTILHYGGEKTHFYKNLYQVWKKENNYADLSEWKEKIYQPDFKKELELLIIKRDEVVQKINDLIVGNPSQIIKIDF